MSMSLQYTGWLLLALWVFRERCCETGSLDAVEFFSEAEISVTVSDIKLSCFYKLSCV